MVIEVEFRCVFVATYFVKTGYCSVHKIALWFGTRKTHFGRRNQQQGEELKKTPVGIKEKDSEKFTVFVLCSCVERKNKDNGVLTSFDPYKRTTDKFVVIQYTDCLNHFGDYSSSTVKTRHVLLQKQERETTETDSERV